MTITAPPLGLLPNPSLLIGDQRIDDATGGVVDHIYGATGQRTAEVILAGPREIDTAVLAARTALSGWSSTTPDQRRELLFRAAQVLREHADELTLDAQVEEAACRSSRRRVGP